MEENYCPVCGLVHRAGFLFCCICDGILIARPDTKNGSAKCCPICTDQIELAYSNFEKEKKMKKIGIGGFALVSLYSIMILILIASALLYWQPKDWGLSKKQLFPNPQNMAQKVANFVVVNGEPRGFNGGTDNEGITHSYNLYSDSQYFEIEVQVYKNGQKDFHINYYLSNRQLENFKTPADATAHELKYGRTEIHIENHIYDRDIDMKVDMFQQFTKKRGPMYMGFTREERDSTITKSSDAGVEEYIFDDEKEKTKAGWKKASDKTVAEISDEYGKYLFVISEKLKIK